MKLIYIFLFSVILSGNLSAQWFWQNPIPGNTFRINKIKFFDENNGMVIGTEGLIYITTNGGYTWGPFYTGFQENLISLSFISAKYGIIISEESILKTTDGGLTWNKILEAGPNTSYQYCSIVDSLNFFVAMQEYGYYLVNSYVMISNDGGITWNKSSGFYGIPKELYFMDKNVGFYFVENKLYRTIDGGINWTSLNFPNMYYLNVSFCDSLNGILIGRYTYFTEDGGLTWDLKNSPPEGVRDGLIYIPNLIIAVGSNKSIYKSTDQGDTWMQLLRLGGGTASEFNSISIINNSYYVSGAGIFKSSDSGESWFSIRQGTTEKLYSIDMVNRDYGIAVGGNGTVVTTHNGGATWQIQNSGTDEYLYSIDCVDTLNALAVGHSGVIIKTIDSGESWVPKMSGVGIPLYHLEMFDENIGMAVGWAGTLLKTNDGGDNWQSQILSDMNFWVSSYMDSSNIFIGGSIANGYGYILRSQNSGLSWDTVYQVLYKFPHSICRLGAQSLLVSGSDGLLIKSTDMGSTWISLNPPKQYHCFTSFIDSLNGLLCFQDGFIYRTTNGGNSWISEWPYHTDLEDIQMLKIEDAIAVGFDGNIISTITDHEMPVELLSFSGYPEFEKVYLNWKTGSERNNLMFEIERSTNKTNWRLIGFREGFGTTTETHNYTFTDDLFGISITKLYYRLKQIDFDGSFEYSDIVEVEIGFPHEFSLSQNYPNPFNPSTIISWQSPIGSWQTLKVYDVLGREVETLVDEYRPAGNYEMEFDGANLSSGIYFYQLQAGDYIETRKMMLLK